MVTLPGIIRFYMLYYIVFSRFASSYSTSKTLVIKISDIFLNIVPIVCRFQISFKVGFTFRWGPLLNIFLYLLFLLYLILAELYTILSSQSFLSVVSYFWIFFDSFSISLFIFKSLLFCWFLFLSFGILLLKVN